MLLDRILKGNLSNFLSFGNFWKSLRYLHPNSVFRHLKEKFRSVNMVVFGVFSHIKNKEEVAGTT